jgi:lactate permease
MWTQTYNPLGNAALSTIAAAMPAVVLLTSITLFRMRIHFGALLGLAVAYIVSLGLYKMPPTPAVAAGIYGAAFGLFPIGWLLLNVIFVYQLTVHRGLFEVLRQSLARLAPDPRIQVVLIAFAFGAFLEGMAGFGAPVAITTAIMIQLGFRPLQACVLALIANTAPVAFGSLGIPITTLAEVTGLDARLLSAMIGRQLAFFSILVPFWVVVVLAGWRGVRGVWPAALVAGIAFTVPGYLFANYHGPWLVGPVSGVSAIIALVVLLRFWRPAVPWCFDDAGNLGPAPGGYLPKTKPGKSEPVEKGKTVFHAWQPWIILTFFIFVWGIPQFVTHLDKLVLFKIQVPYLHHMVQRVPPVVTPGTGPEAAVFKLNPLSATGTGILVAAIVASFAMGLSIKEMVVTYGKTIWHIRFSLLTIATMLALGNLTKYTGSDATLGLALARTGSFYPFFGTLLGWLGVALTGSDTSANVLFGSLQKITAQQIGVSPILMAAANSSGGVMGKMMSAQSIVVATTATDSYGAEGRILKSVFLHSLALVILMGILVYLQAYCPPFTGMVPR